MGFHVKSIHHPLVAICGLNTLLLIAFAPVWWQGLVAGGIAAAAVWLAVQKIEKTLLAPSAVAAEVAIIMPEVPPELSTPSPLPQLMLGVLPAWSNNVELARTQTQEAIDNLTQRFVGIHQRLGGAVSLAAGGKNGDVLLVIQNAAQQLGGVATALEEVLATRDALLTKIETLGQFNDEIRELANRAAQLPGIKTTPDLLTAQQTEDEAAAQTAAHAADIGRQIMAKTKIVKQQIQTALVAANQLNSDAGRMIDNSRAVIAHVIADFRQSALKLSGTVGQLEEENREVDQEVCDILVNLQFQDRISQILGHVRSDIHKLVTAIETNAALPERQQWMDELEQTYTTQEQRQVHGGQQAGNAQHSQVDFF